MCITMVHTVNDAGMLGCVEEGYKGGIGLRAPKGPRTQIIGF